MVRFGSLHYMGDGTVNSLCNTVTVAWARIQVVDGFWRKSLRRGSLLALHS